MDEKGRKQRIWLWHWLKDSEDRTVLRCGSSAKTIKDFRGYESRDALRKAYQEDVGNGDLKVPDAYWSFINEVDVGDIVVSFDAKKDSGKQYHLLSAWGVFTTECLLDESNENPMYRKVEWHESFSPPIQNAEMSNSVFFQGTTDEEARHIKELLGINKKEHQMKNSTSKYVKLLQANRNIILTGAPGTGKTYLAKEIAKEMGAEIGFVQFHPSYDYTDFVEGLRPVSDRNGNVGFERKNGVFKAFCGKALAFSYLPLESPVNVVSTINTSNIRKLPSSTIFEDVYKSIEDDVKQKNVTSLRVGKNTMSVAFMYDRLRYGNKNKSLNEKNLKLMYEHFLQQNIYDLSSYGRDDYWGVITKLTQGYTKTIDYIYYAGMLQEMLNRAYLLEQKRSTEEETALQEEPEPVVSVDDEHDKTPSLEEAYQMLINDLKSNYKSLRFETPTGIPFTIRVDAQSRLIIGDGQYAGTPLTFKMIKGFYDGTRPGSFYRSHCKAVVNYLQKTYHFHDDDYVVSLLQNKATKNTNPNQPHVFIIDEINRGEISKIFGELFFSIDPGYRGEKGKVQTQYQNLIEDGDVFKDGFYVPENVYIIGTMNDIDRSVESMDFAMRRRFAWVEVTAEESYQNMIENDAEFVEVKDAIRRRMESLNKAILDKRLGLGDAYQIGAAYFRKVAEYQKEYGTDRAFTMLWENHLKGLLFEYLRGNQNAREQLETLKKAYELNGNHHDKGQLEDGSDE